MSLSDAILCCLPAVTFFPSNDYILISSTSAPAGIAAAAAPEFDSDGEPIEARVGSLPPVSAASAPVVLRRDKKKAERAFAAATAGGAGSKVTAVPAVKAVTVPRPTQSDLDKKERAPPSKDVFAGKSWSDLGLNERIVAHLQGPMNKAMPTKIQSLAIPKLVEGRDLLIQSPTGTGKTLAYLLPVLHNLAALPRKLTREDGMKALVIAPTRELCLQIYQVLEFAIKPCIWIVPGHIIGGEKKKSEKARLRKGTWSV